MEGRLLARARAKQETLRAENRAEEDRRRREIAAKIPEIGRIDTALCANLSEMVRVAMRQSARTAQELEKESLALQEKRSALLMQNGYPKDYLDPIYSCPRCRDTGWTDGKICECVQKLYRAEQTRELAPLLKQGDETFENFRLDYYSPVAPASGVSPRAQMERVLRICRAYAESFGAQSPNLLFTGEPGLGKTFLSAAIARVVAAKGCGVAYDTASGLLASFEREKFSRDTDEVSDAASRVRQLMSCDLLILDDLGTEFSSPFTVSCIYNIINGRMLAGRSTVVSTNLSQQELAAYRRAEQAERNAMVRARKLREQLSLLCEQSKDRYTDAGEEISALTADLSSGLSRLQETLADIQAIFDDAESAFDELQLPGEDDV